MNTTAPASAQLRVRSLMLKPLLLCAVSAVALCALAPPATAAEEIAAAEPAPYPTDFSSAVIAVSLKADAQRANAKRRADAERVSQQAALDVDPGIGAAESQAIESHTIESVTLAAVVGAPTPQAANGADTCSDGSGAGSVQCGDLADASGTSATAVGDGAVAGNFATTFTGA